jgi:hypothetical protein
MKRASFVLISILILLWAILWISASALTPKAVQHTIPKLLNHVESLGIGLNEMSFASVRVSPWLNGIALRAFHARFDLNPRDDIRLQSMTNMEELEIRLQNPFTLRGIVRVQRLEVRFDPSDLPASMPYGRFTNGTLFISDLLLARPKQMALEIREELKRLFIENETVGDVQFSGDVKLKVEDEEIIAHLYTERQGKHFRLRFRDTDIANLSQRMQLDLAPEQVDIVSRYPLRAPLLLFITDQARDFSRQHEQQDVWRRDALRHVSWSFLLTKQFGAEFAKTVTDAQEMRPGNTPDERAMDFHNNAIGRRLFAKGEKLEALPQRVRQDPEIIRHPDQVEAFTEQRLFR